MVSFIPSEPYKNRNVIFIVYCNRIYFLDIPKYLGDNGCDICCETMGDPSYSSPWYNIHLTQKVLYEVTGCVGALQTYTYTTVIYYVGFL